MTEKEYNDHPGVRRSDLWKISESPEKYWYAIRHPIAPTPAMIYGAACHMFILEPDEWSNFYSIAPNIDRRTKAGKEEWDQFVAASEGRSIVTQDDFDTMHEMSLALMRNSIANQLIYGKGQTELPFFWTDKDTGEQCKVKLDRLVRLGRKGQRGQRFVVVDYKTAQSAQTDKFCHTAVKLGYHLQAAMYTEGVMKCKRLKYRPDFIFVVQEKTPPYSVNIIYVTADSSFMLYGYDTFRELIGTLHQCKETDFWYGYTGAFGEMSEAYLPGYITLGDEE